MIGISSDKAFERLAEALGTPQWIDDPQFLTNSDRVRNTAELDRRISEVLGRHGVGWWADVLDKHDIAFDPVQTPEQVMSDPQLAALHQLEEIQIPGAESARVPRLPLELSETPTIIQGGPPMLGEHTRAILREASFPDADIDELLRQGVCEVAS
jgi:crotonobetainyl-CoA:carnitine CoA-transferase CaiB-like acyl-CoA transferase